MKATPSVLRPSSVRELEKVAIVNISKRHFNDRQLEVLQKGQKYMFEERYDIKNLIMEDEYLI